MTRIAVVGGGAWGTALADLLARKGDFDTVTLWAREPEVVESVNREHVNHMFLPGAAVAPAVAAVGDLTAAVRGAEVVVSAAPSHAVREVMTRARDKIGRGALVVSVSKGLDPERLSTPSCVLADVLPKDAPIAVLSGPSRSEEHTSELQSRLHLVCRLLLEKKKKEAPPPPYCDRSCNHRL